MKIIILEITKTKSAKFNTNSIFVDIHFLPRKIIIKLAKKYNLFSSNNNIRIKY